MRGVLFVCVATLALASCAKQYSAQDTITRGQGVIIISMTNGNKVLQFDNGTLACFDHFGNVCEDFRPSTTMVFRPPPTTVVIK